MGSLVEYDFSETLQTAAEHRICFPGREKNNCYFEEYFKRDGCVTVILYQGGSITSLTVLYWQYIVLYWHYPEELSSVQ